MRFIAPLLLSTLLPAVALADVNAVDDEPMPRTAAASTTATATTSAADPRLPSETGQLRSAHVVAPMPGHVDDGSAVAREHDVAPPHAVAASATDSDVTTELAARQLMKEAKRHQRALDGCKAAARKRAPAAAGSLTLDFEIADRKVKSVRVSDDEVHDFDLAACVTQVARSFSFSLAAAHVRWPVALR